MRPYELMVIFDPELDDRQVGPTMEKFLGVVKTDGGSVDNIDVWGRRRLAYPIKKKDEGSYVVTLFTRRAGHGQELDRQLGLSELVMRTKLLRADA